MTFDLETSPAPPAPEYLSPPSASDMTGGLEVDAWLQKEVEILSQSTPASQAMSVGLMLRLWHPLNKQNKQVESARLHSGKWIGLEAAKQWARSLTKEQVLNIESETAQMVQFAFEQSDGLSELASQHPDSMDVRALMTLIQRDEIQCVISVLELIDHADHLKQIAQQLDERIGTELTLLQNALVNSSNLEISSNPRIHAISWQEPHHWWGRIEDVLAIFPEPIGAVFGEPQEQS